MFRVSHFMQALGPTPPPMRIGKPSGPVVIWNLVRRCNLTCKHCYSISADVDFPGELDTQQVFGVMDDLKQYGVPVLILSGGEPLLRPDIFEISQHAKDMGFYTALSTNGTLIDESNIDKIAEMNYDYLGISIDGMRETHDYFRRKQGAFDEAMHGIRLCRDKGIKVGLRFTVTQDNAEELSEMLELINREKIDKFYLSHLNYAGRGDKNRKDDAAAQMTRDVMDQLFEAAWQAELDQTGQEFVTGNNDADGVYFLQWVRERFPDKADDIQQRLIQWGGNASGVNISNIDNLGNVHPDTMWWNYNLGNVKDRPFSEIWSDTTDPLMAGLKQSPRPLKGRCRVCHYRNICGGNTRTRAFQVSDDPWWQDPGCYLSDEELGITPADYENDQPETNQLQRRKIRRAS
jgi:heme d1 biosynthesis radical SAM protein NirJ